MKLIRSKKVIFWAVCILLAIILAVFGARHSGNGNGAGGNHSGGDSYDSTAWKFANLVQPDVLYPVVRDIDGDTIVANVVGHDITVRLIGADTPETVDPRKPVQCYGPQASMEAKRIFGHDGSVSVYLDKDPVKGDYDKYGRLLAYVRLPEDIISDEGVNGGTDLYNEYMIQQGFAREYTYLGQLYKYQVQFKADEMAAKKARLGLWGSCNVSSPSSATSGSSG